MDVPQIWLLIPQEVVVELQEINSMQARPTSHLILNEDRVVAPGTAIILDSPYDDAKLLVLGENLGQPVEDHPAVVELVVELLLQLTLSVFGLAGLTLSFARLPAPFPDVVDDMHSHHSGDEDDQRENSKLDVREMVHSLLRGVQGVRPSG